MPDPPSIPALTLAELERLAIEQALRRHNQNRTHAAAELGITVRTIQRKIKEWGRLEAVR